MSVNDRYAEIVNMKFENESLSFIFKEHKPGKQGHGELSIFEKDKETEVKTYYSIKDDVDNTVLLYPPTLWRKFTFISGIVIPEENGNILSVKFCDLKDFLDSQILPHVN